MQHVDTEWLSQIENQLRAGQLARVRRSLSALNANKIPRAHLLSAANLARRAGLPNLAIRWLRPLTHDVKRVVEPATTDELAGYAIALHRVGASEEAMMRLQKLKAEECPLVWLYKSFISFSKWDYAQAIPDLKRYSNELSLSSYERLVGCLNLAAAFVAEDDFGSADALLKEVLAQSKNMNFQGIHGSALELSAQVAFSKEDYNLALELINANRQIANAQAGQYSMWSRKWACLIDLYKNGVTKSRLSELAEVRASAWTAGDSETARECDLYKALVTKDDPLFIHVYYGTPLPSYRRRMLKLVRHAPKLPETYVWSPDGESKGWHFDLNLGRDSHTGIECKGGQSTHRLLWALSCDFYKRLPVGSLFHHLFPGEFLDPDTSRDRVQAIIYRSRSWLTRNSLPLKINVTTDAESGGNYNLSSEKGYGLQVTINRTEHAPVPHEVTLARIEEKWPRAEFAAQDVSKSFKLSVGTVIAALNWGLEKNRLKRETRDRKTRYLFNKAA